MDYRGFLDSKRVAFEPSGFDVDERNLLTQLKPFQADAVRYAIRLGRAASFQECGLGKTIQQLEYAYHVIHRTGRRVLLLCPLAVSQQTLREAEKFGVSRGLFPVSVVKSQADITHSAGIYITNYEKRKHFDHCEFEAVLLDESSILKSYTGVIKNDLCRTWQGTPYKLASTATPSPNDLMELGNHSEFLSVMPSSEMLARWFINDAAHVGKYRLKGYAEDDYWRWVSSFAVCLSTPADLGYDDSEYILPPLNLKEHVVANDDDYTPVNGCLFKNDSINATSVHKEKRSSVNARAEVVAGLVNSNSRPWIVWCDTDYESDALLDAIGKKSDVVEVRGSYKDSKKEQLIDEFSTGNARVIITKPKICGFGVNWQHCSDVAFVGVSYSFEQFYQAVRRTWRFGQKRPVDVHVVNSEAEQVIWNAVMEKERGHLQMQSQMALAMRATQIRAIRGNRELLKYSAGTTMDLPSFLSSKGAT